MHEERRDGPTDGGMDGWMEGWELGGAPQEAGSDEDESWGLRGIEGLIEKGEPGRTSKKYTFQWASCTCRGLHSFT